MMSSVLLALTIPFAASGVVLIIPNKPRALKEMLSLLAAFATLALSLSFYGRPASASFDWAGFGINLSFRVYNFSALLVIATSFFAAMLLMYSCVFMRGRENTKLFYSLILMSVGFVNGGLLADNLICLLFFWEALLFTTYGMIAIGKTNAFKTATKAFIIVGIGDIFMVVGAAICYNLAGTLRISELHIDSIGLGALAFVLLMIGALAKTGSMPFHSWIPDAATDAPLPFMAFAPASLDKVLGIYFLTRISLDIFRLHQESWASYTLMTIGGATIILAVMMALIQKDYKKLLSYHAISQAGYMILGIGSATPAGIVGGIFHMINNALYKSGLFLTAGSMEKQAGTTDLEKLGGMATRMPVTFACFVIMALSISGTPPFNGFFSKELIYDAAIERGTVFYLAAIAGSFLTAASFLKLGHAAFLGKASEIRPNIKEPPIIMLVPMIVITAACVLLGLRSAIPIRLILPVLNGYISAQEPLTDFAPNLSLIAITLVVLTCALLNHILGVIRTGSGLKAVDHIHYAPLLHSIYDKAEKGIFDPYNIGTGLVKIFSVGAAWCDKAIDRVYGSLIPTAAETVSFAIRKIHNGSYKTYILWSLAALFLVIIVMFNGLK
ncbi:MAG: NADH-quinone oxidoreductase subunit L [Candidatus Omnitrophica bacterium]|nr:NADH-quinone oxidoreductase subunit L [Candidatus Omnitrophota bacterium]